MAMERALSHLADAESAIDDCASCLARDVIVSEAQAADHNRSIVCARNALLALKGQLQAEHGLVCRHLRDAQMSFLHAKPLISLATGYTGSVVNEDRDLDLSGLAYVPCENSDLPIDEAADRVAEGQVQAPAASSAAPYVNRIHEGNFEAETRNEDALTSISSAISDDECDTVKGPE